MKADSQYLKLSIGLLIAVAAFRAIYVWIFPFDLSGDEAYYWDWGRQLSWGYFSKPPMIAWIMALAGWISNDSDTGIRLFAVFLGTASLLFIYLMGKRMWGYRVGFWALLLTIASPGNVAVNLILTIDAPLLFFWTGALLSFYLYLESNRHSKGWLVTLMFMLGLGLLSKQMMAVFYPLAIAYLATTPVHRSALKDWKLWSSWIISAGFLIPTLIWNTQNGWITAKHTQHHFESKAFSFIDILERIGEFIGSQFGVVSPVTFIAVVVFCVLSTRSFKTLDHRLKYLAIFSVPGLVMVSLMLLRQSINPNWPAVFYPSAVIGLAAIMTGSIGFNSKLPSFLIKWKYPSLITGAFFAVLTMALPFILIWTGQTGSKLDPVIRLQGWSELGDAVQKYRELHSHDLNDPFIIASGHRYTTSHLAFYLLDQPSVYHWPETPGTIESQYQLWGFPDNLDGRDAFIVVPGQNEPVPESLKEVFKTVKHLDDIVITKSAKRTRYYSLYSAKSLQLR